MTTRIQKTHAGWQLLGGDLVIDINSETGCLQTFEIHSAKPYSWSSVPGDVKVRDDLLRYEFDSRDITNVEISQENGTLFIEKQFVNAPWILKESYCPTADTICWNAEVILDSGDYRSCCITYSLPWTQPLYPVKFWTASEKMPSAPHRFAEIALEYGEITSGILIPALCAYLEKEDVGFLAAMPFDFKTPRFRFISSYREPDLKIQFDWLALAPGRSAKTALMLKGTGGAWRPALGWLFEQYREYFEPRSNSIHDFWGGHVSGSYNVSSEEVLKMKELGLKWHEICSHFPAFGNYHPENLLNWRSGHKRKDETPITVDMIERTIKNLKEAGVGAFPYIQVTGDGKENKQGYAADAG